MNLNEDSEQVDEQPWNSPYRYQCMDTVMNKRYFKFDLLLKRGQTVAGR